MPSLGLPEPESLADDLVEVGTYPSAESGSEHGLVVLALGKPYWLMPAPDGFRLYVEQSAAEKVRSQLAAYARESRGWPPAPVSDPWVSARFDIVTPLVWSSLVLMLYHLERNWIEAGLLDARAVFIRHEYWRCFTALFLHGDAGHVISNALSGVFVFGAVLTTIGRLRGWLLVAAAGTIGNLVSAWMQFPREYHSLGASTAIFGALGLLVGRATRIGFQSTHPHRWRALFVPIATGLTVLGLYGVGGVKVDVGAHVTGLLSGVVLGFFWAAPRAASAGPRSPV